ncbi:MAG TPA: F0F1 ATP synthase subunit B [Candidatus Limnocylindria bacterium]|jgi:F-type H+-transporting ATPase subunit b|nr:F0F1 ATP synthase subunit B [Candidatus Limnocylindria bacterium]
MAFFEAFGVDVWKLAFQIVNFLVLLYLLNRFLFKPALRRIDERQGKLSQGLEDAAAAARDRELARAEREAALAEARQESDALVQRAAKTAEATSAEILAEARASAEQLLTRARDEIAAEKEKALTEIRGEVASLALDAAGKLVGSEMDSPTQRRLVEQFLSENRN